MTARSDLERLRRTLALLPRRAEVADRALDALHSLAYDRGSSGAEPVSASRQAWYLDEVGSAKAKRLLRDLIRDVDRVVTAFDRTVEELADLVNGGPGPDATLRGTLLGDDDGHGADAELRAALKAQARRRGRGEFTPAPTERQPGVR